MPRSDGVVFVFYDFETEQNTNRIDTSFKHVPIVLCVQQFCTVCDDEAYVEFDYRRCGKKNRSFWLDPVW